MSPWQQFAPAIFETCEPTVRSWIAHPAETISALAYVAAALFLWRRFGRVDRALAVRYLPVTLVVIGTASLLFHASYAAVFQVVDIAAIPLFTGYMLAATVVHRRQVDVDVFPRLFWTFVSIGVAVPLVNLTLGFIVVVLQGLMVVWFWGRQWVGCARSDARLGLSLLLPGAVLLLLDHAAVGCVTGAGAHLLQPHVAWHLLSAASAVFFYRAERLLERQWSHSLGPGAPQPPPTER